MDALKCHQDLLVGKDRTGLLRQYVAKYLAEFSDSASQDWLNDEADAVSIAATVLYDCGRGQAQLPCAAAGRGRPARAPPCETLQELGLGPRQDQPPRLLAQDER